MSAKSWVIRHRDGTEIHTREGKSFRKALLDAIRAGVDLRGVDLRKCNLSRLDLSGVDLRGANLDGADLRGAILNNTHMDGASMRGVRAEGASFDFASMISVEISDSDFCGASFWCADMRRASVTDTNMSRTNMPSARMCQARFLRSSFREATMENADFRNSEVVECNFEGAKLTHRAFTGMRPEEAARMVAFLPDRTKGARVMGCSYDAKTVLCDTVSAMQRDRVAVRMTKSGLWAASTLTAVAGVDAASELLSVVGSGMTSSHVMAGGVVIVLSALTLLKEGVVERVRIQSESKFKSLVDWVREASEDYCDRGVRKWNLVCLMGRQRSLDPIRLSLASSHKQAVSRGFFGLVHSFATEMGDVVLCDRRHLALALSTLCAARETGFCLRSDITLLNFDRMHRNPESPTALRLRRDGTSAVTWPCGDSYVTIMHAADGHPISVCDAANNVLKLPVQGLPAAAMHRVSAIQAMETSLLEANNLKDFHYDRAKYRLDEGRDSTLLVRVKSNGRIGNEIGQPAIVPLEGDPLYLRNGSVVAP